MLYLEARLRGQSVRWGLSRGKAVLGREETCDFVVDDQSISRQHLSVTVQQGRVRVEDLGSRNGLWIDSERVSTADVAFDQWFVAGTVLMAVREGVTLSTPGAPTPDSQAEAGGLPKESTQGLATGPAGQTATPASSLGSRLAPYLRSASTPEDLVPSILRATVDFLDVNAAVFLIPVGNGWCVHAIAGSAEIPVLELSPHLSGHRPAVIDGAEGTLLRVPVGDAALLLGPWDASRKPGSDLDPLCGWIEWARNLADGKQDDSANQPTGVDTRRAPDAFVAESEPGRALLTEVDRLATAADLTILLQGESGTGKELLAHRLHQRSDRAEGPFIAVNCTAIPRDLVEAELFGIERGVATGVQRRDGRFLQASGGTLFLDEIGDLPMEVQPKLLRILESGEVTPLGAPSAIPLDVRVVAATNRDLAADVEATRFRRDLYYRVRGAIVEVPPLRARAEDILPLAQVFARQAAAVQDRRVQGLDLQAGRLLLGYAWPGNVRELKHAINRAVALSDGPVLDASSLPADVRGNSDPERGDVLLATREDWRAARAKFDRFYFANLLRTCEGNLSEVSRIAGLSRSNLYRHLDELGLR